MADTMNDVTEEIFEQVLQIVDSHQEEWLKCLTDYSDSYYNFGETPYAEVFEQKRKQITKAKLGIILPYGKILVDNLEDISEEEAKHLKGFFAFIASIHILWDFEPKTFEELMKESHQKLIDEAYEHIYEDDYNQNSWEAREGFLGLPNLRYSEIQTSLGNFIEAGMYNASDVALLLWWEMWEMFQSRELGLLRHCFQSFDWFLKEHSRKYQ